MRGTIAPSVVSSALLVTALFASSSASAQDKAEPALALKGYDPVAYFTMARPVRGKSEFQLVFEEARWRFASAEHLAMFRKDPDTYQPRFQGLCAMGLAAKGYKVEADPEHWVIHEGRLYITQRDFGPPAFRSAPGRWKELAAIHMAALKDLPVGSSISWW